MRYKIAGCDIDLFEFDEVIVSGKSSSPIHEFTRLRGMIGAAARPRHDDEHRGGYIKVWPLDGQPDPDGSGKIWFPACQITSVEIVRRDGDYL